MSLSDGISVAPCCLVIIDRIFFEVFMAVISTERTAMVSLHAYFMCIQPSMSISCRLEFCLHRTGCLIIDHFFFEVYMAVIQ